jgi:hypothetical protein
VRYGWHQVVTDCQKANQGKKAHKALSPSSKPLEGPRTIQTYPNLSNLSNLSTGKVRGVGSEGRPGCSPLSRRSGFLFTTTARAVLPA